MKNFFVLLAIILILFVAYKMYIIGWILIKILIGLGVMILIGLGIVIGYFVGKKRK